MSLALHGLCSLPRLLRPCRNTPSLIWTRLRRTSAKSLESVEAPTQSPSPSPIAPPQPPVLQLRNYQEECVQAVLTAFREGRRQVGVSLATGSGKTVIFTELIGRVLPPKPNATRTLILVHRRELVEQAARHCSTRYPDQRVEIEMGNLKASGVADITIASVQSINSRDRIDKYDPDMFKLILVDEAHHVVAAGYLRVLEHFGLQSDDKPATPALVGVSATFSRFDGLALGKAIKHIVYHKDYVDMIGEKWLSDVIFTTVETEVDVSKVKSSASGDFLTSSLSEAVNTNETNLVTVRAWLARAKGRRSTIVFCVDVEHIKSLAAMFRQHGVDAQFVTGDTPKAIRGARLDAFREHKFPVLLNCGVFTEGTDIPNIDCVLLARPTRSRNLLVQMIGRGMRLYTGKKDCLVLDMVASLSGGIVTSPTLFGLDPSEMLNDADPTTMKTLHERKEREKTLERATATAPILDPSILSRPLSGKITFTDYASVNDLLADSSGDRFIRALSNYAWVAVDKDKYILPDNARGSYLTLETNEEATTTTATATTDTTHPRWLVRHTIKLSAAGASGASYKPLMRPRIVARAETFEAAVHAADTYASKQFTHALITLNVHGGGGGGGGWRQRPASESQLTFLNKFRGEGEQLEAGDVSKGRAGDMITKLKFGARGRFKELKVRGRRADREGRKEGLLEERRRGEVVRVGPLKW